MFNSYRFKKLTRMLENLWGDDYWKPGVHISYLGGNQYYLSLKRYPSDFRQVIIYSVRGSLSQCLKQAIKCVKNKTFKKPYKTTKKQVMDIFPEYEFANLIDYLDIDETQWY